MIGSTLINTRMQAMIDVNDRLERSEAITEEKGLRRTRVPRASGNILGWSGSKENSLDSQTHQRWKKIYLPIQARTITGAIINKSARGSVMFVDEMNRESCFTHGRPV